jgi:hypothetical protein
MPKYRVRAYTPLIGAGFQNNYFKVQQRCWRVWRTVASELYTAEAASAIIRDLLKAEKEFEGENICEESNT